MTQHNIIFVLYVHVVSRQEFPSWIDVERHGTVAILKVNIQYTNILRYKYRTRLSNPKSNFISFIKTFAMLFSQTTFPALYQSLCLSDSDLWLSFSRSSQCEQEIPSPIAKKITPFQQVGFQSKPCILSTKCNNLSLFTGHVRFLYTSLWPMPKKFCFRLSCFRCLFDVCQLANLIFVKTTPYN